MRGTSKLAMGTALTVAPPVRDGNHDESRFKQRSGVRSGKDGTSASLLDGPRLPWRTPSPNELPPQHPQTGSSCGDAAF
ncbi:hypothetical protein MUK42_12898 [Musa troglodytarum]|uniref:Uncharacterized protein n=1 Tax=Musa troglodytarum TaxID=320322 RepID=A0A9E7KKA7_9LILI|nr:hypothetical protein MUK42_12898 [Musa troglodytarum]URE19234.1 hypothetical protein MUK42_12898 [Musa troglodytarum]